MKPWFVWNFQWQNKTTKNPSWLFFYSFYLEKANVEEACMFHLILVGISSSLILSVNSSGGGGGLLSRQNLLYVMKVICLRSHEYKISSVKSLIKTH